MAVFETHLTRRRFTLSPFTSEMMMSIGQACLDHVTARILSAHDVADNPARPLTAKYAERKQAGRRVSNSPDEKYVGSGVRDWKLRGWTLQALKVKSASEDVARIGFTNPRAQQIVNGIQRYGPMWGLSPSDQTAAQNRAHQLILDHKLIHADSIDGPL